MTIRKNKKNKIKSHYGMGDYYKFYKKKYNKNITRKRYSGIISEFNDEICKSIIEDNLEYKIPHLSVKLNIRKDKRISKIVDGKLYNNTPVDWKTTNELWDRDAEAKEKKILVRYNNYHTSGYVFRIYCTKFGKPFYNKKYYRYKTSRKLQRMLAKRIKDENKSKLEAFKLY